MLLDGQISCCKGNNMNKASEGQWLASRQGFSHESPLIGHELVVNTFCHGRDL